MTTFVAIGGYNRSMATALRTVARVCRLAAGQWGLLTVAQAEHNDITRSQLARLAEAGVLERVERGVYAVTSSADEDRMLKAAWLALDPARTAEERLDDPAGSGVVSHTSAARLHKLGDLLDDVLEVTYPHRKQTRRGIRVHRGDLTDADVTLVDGLPTTTVERTVADLLQDGHDQEHIAQIVGQGVRRGVIDLPDLTHRLQPMARRWGHSDGQSLVAHLLDLAGLSPSGLPWAFTKTSAGQERIAAGGAGDSAENQYVRLQDEFGLPDRMLGRHPDWFYPALGRVAAVCAFLETRAQALAEILAHQVQGTFTKKPIPVISLTATVAAQAVDSANRSMNRTPISPRVVELYERVVEIMDRRHAVIHAVWPAQPEETQFGYRPGVAAGNGEVRVTKDNTRAGMVDLIGNAVAMVAECGNLISPASFAVSQAIQAGYGGTTVSAAQRAAGQGLHS
jgi:hypothetical protein